MTENKNAKTPTDDGHVAHVYLFEKTGRPMVAWDNAKDIKLGDRLYTTPKQWVGLTDEEIYEYADKYLYQHGSNYGIKAFGKAIEAKLKEKNHG
jgi:hypothetical protein